MDEGDTILVTNNENVEKILKITSKSFNTEGGPEMSAYYIFYVETDVEYIREYNLEYDTIIKGVLTQTDNTYKLIYKTKSNSVIPQFFWSDDITEKIEKKIIILRKRKNKTGGYTRKRKSNKRKQNKRRKSRR